MTKKEKLVKEIMSCNFQCEAGSLKDLEAFDELLKLIPDKKQKKEELKTIVAMMPPLTRAIIVLDLETTGTDPDRDMIVEITALKIFVGGSEEERTSYINPGIPIPKAATDVHGITDAMVKDKPTFAHVSKALLQFISGCDIVGFHSNGFDIPMLNSMFNRVGLTWDWRSVNLIDARNIFVQKEPRTLEAGVRFYLGRDHEGAHGSSADVHATKEIFIEQLSRYEDLPKDFKSLALYSNYGREIVDMAGKFILNDVGEVVFNFGSHKGKLAKNEKSYLQWMCDKGDFSRDTKNIAQQILLQ